MAGQGFRTFVDLDILTAEQVNDYLMSQAVMVFDDATDRSTQLGASVAEGMVSYLKDTDQLEKYNGAAWVNITADSIAKALIDAKGDLIVGTADNTPARLAVGTNEHRVVADSSTSTGLAYVADTTNFAVAAKGDLLAGTAADTVEALTVGTNGHVLTADSSTATGLAWAAAAAGGGDLVRVASASPSADITVSFDNVFTSTYANYLIVLTLVSGGTNQMSVRLRVSGSDNTTTNYNEQFLLVDGTSVSGLRQSSQSAFAVGGLSVTGATLQVLVSRPQLAHNTQMFRHNVDTFGGGTSPRFGSAAYHFNATTVFDGISFFMASPNTMTGKIDIYGLGI
jgi:hypothetical protein